MLKKWSHTWFSLLIQLIDLGALGVVAHYFSDGMVSILRPMMYLMGQ